MFEIGPIAYCKMVLHAIKYPHCSVRGVLLGKRSSKNKEQIEDTSKFVTVVDAIPGFHTQLLAPPLETLFFAP